MKIWIEKTVRNWYLLVVAGVCLGYYGDVVVWKTLAAFAGVLAFVVWCANLSIHAFTDIEWRNWKDNDEFEKVGKCIVLAAVLISCALVATAVFGNFGIHTSDAVIPGNVEQFQK